MSQDKIKDFFVSHERKTSYIRNFMHNAKKCAVEKRTPVYVQGKIDLLQEYWKKFVDRHELCFDHQEAIKDCCPDTTYFDSDPYLEIEDIVALALSELSSWLPAPPEPTPSESGDANRSSNQETLATLERFMASQAFQTQHILRAATEIQAIPALAIPTFSGKFSDWESFKYRFVASVVNKSTYSDGLKLQYLLNALQGAAADILKGVKPEGTNFTPSWDKLCRRYDNPKRRLTTHLLSIQNLKPITEKSASQLNDLLDKAEESIQGFKDLNCAVEHWDVWLVHCVVTKLDSATREAWEMNQLSHEGFSTFKDLRSFIENRIYALDTSAAHNSSQPKSNASVATSNSKTRNPNSSSTGKSVSVNVASTPAPTASTTTCCVCCAKQQHPLHYCSTFKSWNQKRRFDFIKQNQLCINCLKLGHNADKCPSKFRCKQCKKPHHSLLHFNTSNETRSSTDTPQSVHHSTTEKDSCGDSKPSVGQYTTLVSKSGLLATARIVVISPPGETLEIRALIDPCAERSFISERIVQTLSLKTRRISQDVCFLGGKSRLTVTCEALAAIGSKLRSDFCLKLQALVLPELTRVLPAQRIEPRNWPHIANLILADPDFSEPDKVDCVLAADVYAEIMTPGLKKGPKNTPLAQNTVFGWILTGATGDLTPQSTSSNAFHVTIDASLSHQLQRFWEIEEVPCESKMESADDRYCEDYFTSTVSRSPEGRLIVRLPFTQSTNLPAFSDSRNVAVACLLRSERRRQRDTSMDAAYCKFMHEYEALGHMERIITDEQDESAVFLPHHAVFKKDSHKIRVVFNASQKYGNGHCINDFLLAGPKLQTDIAIILTRWRNFQFVFTTDIVKMYRQILVHKDDQRWQAIVWRDNSSQAIFSFLLRTVTYGTKCAPFLAIRCLLYLAEIYADKFPLAAMILRWLSYIDDSFGGADSLEEAIHARDQLITLLACAQISLGKWAANHPQLLQGLSVDGESEVAVDLEDVVSTLGIRWMPHSDSFSFKVDLPAEPVVVTKRVMLSEVAKLFDPLGWLSPFLVQCKIILRKAWLQQLEWDTPIGSELLNEWHELRSQLPQLAEITIPRWTNLTSSTDWILHGFGDASEKAYAAAVYLVVPGHSSHLLMSKNRVAPAKTLSVPRLELCAAVLLARLIVYLNAHFLRKPVAMFCWSDSKVVLDWLASPPARWQTFVANRVSTIVRTLPEAKWAHTSTLENPADLATRGVTAAELKTANLWWHGPEWLVQGEEFWPAQDNVKPLEQLEIKAFAVMQTSSEAHVRETLLRSSSFGKIIRIVAYMLRWKRNTKVAKVAKAARRTPFLNVSELRDAEIALFRLVQAAHYTDDLEKMAKNQPLRSKSQLLRLSPFLCPKGLLRVGGRLHNAPVPYNEAHPIILPANSPFVKRMIELLHITTLHGGTQLMLSCLHQRFWVPRVIRVVQGVVKRCVRCVRHAARSTTQQMAPLPEVRVTPAMAFQATGIDYAGPISVLATRARGSKTSKGYFAIFICMFSRGIHIEVVSDLTTDTFLAAFRRFTSRRGHCADVYSDNGRNFTGASKELRSMFNQASAFSQEVARLLANDRVTWHFSPPRAPHFGGLWERAVRSFKHHLYRVIGDSTLTAEELRTVSTQIEACLNSRPICPQSSEGNDLVALTPAHFLIGRSITAVAEPFDKYLTHKPSSRWRLIQRMRNDFWIRWRSEVLHQYQQRGKWLTPQRQIQVNDMVLVTDELTPPTKWPLGRVTAVYPGKDGLVRAADVRTAASQYRRALNKLVVLPMDQDDQDDAQSRPDVSNDQENQRDI